MDSLITAAARAPAGGDLLRALKDRLRNDAPAVAPRRIEMNDAAVPRRITTFGSNRFNFQMEDDLVAIRERYSGTEGLSLSFLV